MRHGAKVHRMIDWDDVRYFLAVARAGSVRAAAERLHVNHATVLRRIAQLEQQLGAHVFEKLPSGYRLTSAGEEIIASAEQMEAASKALEMRILGRDQSISGHLRVTLPLTLAAYLLAPDFVTFARLHPEVEVEVVTSNDWANLTNREADLAIRVVYDRNTLPPHLHCVKGPDLWAGVYMSRDLFEAWRAGTLGCVRWIVKDNYGIPDWACEGAVKVAGTPFRTTDAETQIVAVRAGLGITTLSCFVGDSDPELVRVPGSVAHSHGTIWLLTYGETRKTKRVRLFLEFIASRLLAYEPLLTGRCGRGV